MERACAWALEGTIVDAKTVIGLLRARHILGAPPGRTAEKIP